MRLSDKDFFEKVIDRSIPELDHASRLFSCGKQVEAKKAFADFLKDRFPDERIRAFPRPWLESYGNISEEEYAEEILNGYICSVGYKYQFKDGIIDWAYNPTFNNYVEFTYHLQYHTEMLILAWVYERTGDERYASRFDYMINSWIAQAECPEDTGGGLTMLWRTLEAGLRMGTRWPTFINIFMRSPSIPDRTWINMFKSIWEHGYRLMKNNTQRGHNNWIITEMVGLATMGVCYPFMTDAGHWLDYALRVLGEEINAQIYPDGMQIELTSGYHGGIISNFMRVKQVLELYGIDPPPVFAERVRLMYSMYVKLCKPNLKTPGLNDGSEADVPQAMKRAVTYFPDDDCFRYFATSRKEGTPPPYTSLVLPYAGFAVMRTNWSKDAIWAFLDAGPEGQAHVHEDKLAFQLYAYGTDMLSDTGTYAYDTSDMRKYVIGTRSHCTGIVDGKHQNRLKTHKRGLPDIAKADFSYSFGDEYELAEGYYDQGYGDELIDVKHTRRVIFFKKGLGSLPPFFIFLDRFESRDGEEHNCEVSFQLPHVPISAFEHSVEAKYGNGATLKMVSDCYPKIQIGQYAPEFIGWQPIHGTEEHEHSPSPVVSFTKRGLESRFATLLIPFGEECKVRASVNLCETGFEIFADSEHFRFDYDDPKFAAKSNIDNK